MFWNELFVTPIQDYAGKVVLFAGVQNDTTERRVLEQETQRFAAALKQVNEAVLVTDAQQASPGPPQSRQEASARAEILRLHGACPFGKLRTNLARVPFRMKWLIF